MAVEIVADHLKLTSQVFNGKLPVSLRRSKIIGDSSLGGSRLALVMLEGTSEELNCCR